MPEPEASDDRRSLLSLGWGTYIRGKRGWWERRLEKGQGEVGEGSQ